MLLEILLHPETLISSKDATDKGVEIQIDTAREWDGVIRTPPPPVVGYEWARHETEHPMRVISWAKSALTPDELDAVSQLDQLPQKTSSWMLIGFLGSHTLCTKVFGKLP
ncbi:hypothetical protein LR48_Vigan11g123300 [Vigna angularis]|uniref:Uncharacterized protein n=1 Tax=Phaseolus angularis TaxID=3914 RepID=A0A0L9VTV2_PHAAN|nr:hypothetical protein LR48_Vigan11g123300 [Vigna angularis]